MRASTLLPAALIVGSLAYGAGAIAGTYGGTFGNGGAAGGGGGGGDITAVGDCTTGACMSGAGTVILSGTVQFAGAVDSRTSISNGGSATCDSLAAGSVCVIDAAGAVVSTGGTSNVEPFVSVAPAVSATADVGMVVRYSEAASAWWMVSNNTSGSGVAVPAIQTRAVGANQAGLQVIGGIDAAQDTGTVAGVLFDARRQSGTPTTPVGAAITTRPAFSFGNTGTLLFGLHVNGTHGESTITPTALAANTDNYAGCTSTKVCRIGMGGGSYNLTGLVPTYTATLSERRTICNVDSTGTLTLVDDATSTAANRFQLNANFGIVPERCVDIQYDLTSSRWRLVGGV